jgi:hypothetical protein
MEPIKVDRESSQLLSTTAVAECLSPDHKSDTQSSGDSSDDSRPSSVSSKSSSPLPRFPSTMPLAAYAYRNLDDLLLELPPDNESVQAALATLAASLPYHDAPQIISGHPWDFPVPLIRINCHLFGDLEDAVRNIPRNLSEREKMFLRFLIMSPCDWSPTPQNRHTANGFKCLNQVYSKVGPLYPVLDSVVWPEHAAYYPPTLRPGEPDYILLASADSYYLYKFDGNSLLKAGKTLEEVFYGMKADKHEYWGPEDQGWERVEDNEDDPDPFFYFPCIYEPDDSNCWVVTSRWMESEI